MSDNQRPVAYTGDKPYIFVSYCHADSERVFPFILALQERYNVWFDEGIHYGREWDEEIARRLKTCAGVLFMVTEKSLVSKVCEKELRFAQRKDKNVINIMMDSGLALPEWFDFNFGHYHYCKLQEFSYRKDAVTDLTRKSKWLKAIEIPSVPYMSEPVREPKTMFAKPEPIEPLPSLDLKSGLELGLPSVEQESGFELGLPSVETEPLLCLGLPSIKLKSEYEYIVPPLPSVKLAEIEPISLPVLQQVREMPEETIERLKGKLTFEKLPDGTYKLVEGSRELQTVAIPSFVSMIGEEAFVCSDLEHIEIPDSVTLIGNRVFLDCVELNSVRLGHGLKRISDYTFYGCRALRSIRIPEGVSVIGEEAFRSSGLTEITLPTTLKTVEKFAFAYTKLKRVNYCGTRNQWKKIGIGLFNDELDYARITYNYTAP